MTEPVGSLLKRYSSELDKDQPSVDLERIEQGVRGSLRRRASERARSVTRLQLALAAAIVLSIVGGVAAFKLGRDGSASSVAAGPTPAGEWLSSRTGVPTLRRFADGSSLTLEGDSAARVQYAALTGGVVHLDSGVVRLKVRHRDGSSWRVAAGPYEVEAIGTEFSVDWSEHRASPLSVRVSEGTVLLRAGAKSMRFVKAGERFDLGRHASPGDELPESTPAATPALPQPALIASSAAGGDEAWRKLEAAGKYRQAVALAERRGLGTIYRSADSDTLLALARAARFSGRTEVAHDALLACRARFAGTGQAAMSAFLLGRSATGSEAAKWFSTYLVEEPASGLAREALGRLIEAHLQSGDQDGAKSAAARYLKSYPDGPHVALARDVLAR